MKEEGDVAQIVLLLVLSVSMVSSASILIRFSASPPLAIVFWRTLYGSILMAGLAALKGETARYQSPHMKKNWKWLILIGIVLSLHFSTWFTSLFLTTVAASVVLVDSSPIFTAVLSTSVLGEKLGKKSWIGIVIAVVGAIMLTWNDLELIGGVALVGDLLALLGAVFLALYFIGGRKYAKGLPVSVYTSVVYFTAAIATLGFCLLTGVNVMILEPTEVIIFLALAIFPTALGHSVNNYLLTLVPAYVVSAAVLGEPIGATILAMIFLNEIPHPTTALWFCTILIGVALVLFEVATKGSSAKAEL
ncbi:MAG: EamA family transporter [Candidatus Lokiarchaeota archaeon]|nr:EamA family transporter [Candidatus Lokiarchaeota archaeon]